MTEAQATLWVILMFVALTLPWLLPAIAACVGALLEIAPYVAAIWLLCWACS